MINLIFKKIKWFKEYKNELLMVHHDYFDKSLSEIFDFDTITNIYCVTFYDVVNNEDVNKLVKKIYKLKKSKEFEIDINYRKKDIKNINYIRPEFDHNGHGIFANIKFFNDNLVSSVNMAWSQINNEEAIIEYEIKFKRGVEKFYQIHEFVIENYELLKKAKYSDFYFDVDFFVNDELQSLELEYRYFRTILQQKIKVFLSSDYSQKYLLPIKYTYILDKKSNKAMNYIKNPFLEESFIVDKNQYLVINSIRKYEGIEINEFIFKKRFNPCSMLVLLSKIKMPLYYKLFYEIEKCELEVKISKYLNSKKICVNIFDYKWLLNKKRRISEKRFYNVRNNYVDNIDGFSSKEVNFVDTELIKNIEEVYKENLDYMNNLNLVNYNIIMFIVSVLALIIAIIAIFL